MMHNRLFALATVALLIGTAGGPSAADVRRERTDRRPSIMEIGEPYSISMATLQREAAKISELRDFILRNGYPDYAEVQEVAPAWPWESYEVRLYYLQWDIEVDFGHVLFSDALADLGLEKFLGAITPEKRHEIEVILQARQIPPAPPVVEAPPEMPSAPAPAAPEAQAPPPASQSLEALVERLEAAAERASRAADSAVEQSEAAVRAADRTVSIVEKLEESRRSVAIATH
ncbi:MAG TPA: hypothetical protein VMW56_15150 [Candidatus Margulisiibacteriota bacterium]|nr:hypothetical protein [Candidatus Margulisiibacteriota bacterium]